MSCKVKVRPFRQLQWDTELRCERLRGVGFVARCDCGEKSRVVASHAAARAWARLHMKMGEGHVSGEQ